VKFPQRAENSRSCAERAKCEGRKKILKFSTFIEHLGSLLDTMLEMSELAIELQNIK
jgi:hypothetical protein